MTLKALVLDDDHARLASFRTWLTEPGVELVCVETAEACIEQLKTQQFHAVFLDHDLGGEVYVDTDREDCGMEVARQVKAATEIKQDPRTLWVIHTLNIDAGYEMACKIKDAGYFNVTQHAYTQMVRAGGINLQENDAP